jgi:hypothetical protein
LAGLNCFNNFLGSFPQEHFSAAHKIGFVWKFHITGETARTDPRGGILASFGNIQFSNSAPVHLDLARLRIVAWQVALLTSVQMGKWFQRLEIQDAAEL